MAKDGVVKSGSVSVFSAPKGKDQDTAPKDPETGSGTKNTPESKGEGEKLLAGKYKTPDDLVKGYESLSKKFGDQGQEISDLRKQTQQLMGLLESSQKQKPGESQKADKTSSRDNLTKALSELKKLDFIDDDSANEKMSGLLEQVVKETAALTKSETEAHLMQMLQERDEDAVRTRFLKENPDFNELRQSGAFQALKNDNPVHDDVSAYYALKQTQAQKQVADLEAQLAEAKKLADIASGADGTSKVFTKPGGSVRDAKPKPKTHADRIASAIKAVEAVSQGS